MMTQKSFPWTNDATGDGTSGGYTALEWGELWRRLFLGGNEATQGVLIGIGNTLAVSGTASPVSVATGAAVVYGKLYYNDAATTLAITTPVVGTTGGHVILRLDWAAQTVRVVAVRNTDGVNATPALTQSASTQWEIRLASFTITTGGVVALTDTRAYCHFSSMVSTAMLDNDCVDTTKAGNGITQLISRVGGDASRWSTVGTTVYSVGAVKEYLFALDVQFDASYAKVLITVTFPAAFSDYPLVFPGVYAGTSGYAYKTSVQNMSTTGCAVNVERDASLVGSAGSARLFLIVKGPE